MKVKLTMCWFKTGLGTGDREGDPASEPKTIVIDTEVNRKYDGAETLEDVKLTFLQGVTQDPMHNVVLQVTECVKIN